MNYSTTIILDVGLAATNDEAVLWSIPIVLVQFIMAMMCVKVIDNYGRKPLLKYSLIGVTISLLLLSISVFIVKSYPINSSQDVTKKN